MSAIEVSATVLADHLPLDRLLDVVTSDDFTFSPEEFNHLKACSKCLRQWTEVIDYLHG
jgi:hypothetical protein